mmetsp:Transcript_2973/g.4600  ORF Transcript_2973/g.4600 Transcript_2973/m.4600 type:complete len:83 (-) Transcript_2973:663-911(-)
MKGGFYSYDIDEDITIVGLNTILWNRKNPNRIGEDGAAMEMVHWLDKLAKENPQKSFIPIMHIFPGLNYYKKTWIPGPSDPI